MFSAHVFRYSGFYKGVQSAGAAIAWQVDTRKVPFLTQLIINWSLTTVSYPLLLVLVMLAVKDEKKVEEEPRQEALLTSTGPVYAADASKA